MPAYAIRNWYVNGSIILPIYASWNFSLNQNVTHSWLAHIILPRLWSHYALNKQVRNLD